MNNVPELTIVIPVFNEGNNILATLNAIRQQVTIPAVIRLVYDFEEDTTLSALKSLDAESYPTTVRAIRNAYGRGALNAIKTGLESAETELIIVTMADLSDPPEVMNNLVQTAKDQQAAIVCASRYMKGGRQIGGPKLKGLLSHTAGLLLYRLAGLPTHDPTNSFKLYRKTFLKTVTIESTGGFELGLELVVKAHKHGFTVAEVPTVWRDRVTGKSNFKLWKWLPHYLRWFFYAFWGFPKSPRPAPFSLKAQSPSSFYAPQRKPMRLTLVMLTWNRFRFLEESLSALLPSLSGLFEYEIVVMDNGSTDQTAEVLHHITQKNPGVITVIRNSRNQGLNAYKKLFGMATGDYIIEVDDDILAFPKNFDQIMVDYLSAYPDYGFLALDVVQNEKTNGAKPDASFYHDDIRGAKAVSQGPAGGWCSCFRKKDFRFIRPFFNLIPLHMKRCEDGTLVALLHFFLRKKAGIIKQATCLHACGPYYARLYGQTAREVEKYLSSGLTKLAENYLADAQPAIRTTTDH